MRPHDVVVVQVLERQRRVGEGKTKECVVATDIGVSPPLIVADSGCDHEGVATLRVRRSMNASAEYVTQNERILFFLPGPM